MGFIDGQVIDAQLLKRQQSVAHASRNLFHSGFNLCDQGLGLLDAERLTPARVGSVLSGLVFRVLHRLNGQRKLFFQVAALCLRRDANAAER